MRSARRLTTVLGTLGVLIGGLVFASAPALAAEQWRVLSTFGGTTSTPADPEPLSGPDWVAVNQSTNDVYVVDKNNNRVERFSATGEYNGQFNGESAPTGALSSPGPIAVDSDPSSPSFGDVYVIDTGHNVVDKFTASGAYLGQITTGAKGAPFGSGELSGVTVDSSGEVWISQAPAGNPVGIGLSDYSSALVNAYISTVETEGVYYPGYGLALDSEGDLYISSVGYFGVQEFSPEGHVLVRELGGEIGVPGFALDLSSNDLYIDTGTSVSVLSRPAGSPIESFGAGPLAGGAGIAVNYASGDVYVAEPASNRVLIFEHSSTPQTPPPPPITDPATQVTSTSATLNGELNPEGAPGGLGYYFSYNAGAGSSCTGPGSVRSSFDGGAANAKGNTEVPAPATVSLHPHEEYSFCLVADKYGATVGPQLTLTTGAAEPEIVSEGASSAGDSNEGPRFVEFTAEVNPESEETSYYFEYSEVGVNGNEELEGEVQTVGGGPLAPEFGERTASVGFKGPSSTASYYYRLVATNGTGTKRGKVEVYTKLPVVANEKLSALTSTSVKLEATVNPDFKSTRYRFEYAAGKEALEKGAGTTTSSGEIAEEPSEPIPVGTEISALQAGHTYYYRVVAENEISEYAGNINKGAPIAAEIKEFTPYAAPAVTTGEAQNIARTSATLSGVVDPEGAETTYYFAYIGEAGYEKAINGDAQEKANPYAEGETTASLTLVTTEVVRINGQEVTVPTKNAYESQAVGPILASGLRPGETYHYALVAVNKFAIRGIGPDHTFKAGDEALPIVSTGGASGVSQNSATLSGTVGTNGLQTSYGFEIGTEPGNYGPATGLGSIGGAATVEVHVTLGELQPGTTYYYRVTATNADGTERSQPESFTTPGFPTLISSPASPPLVAYTSPGFPTEEKPSGTTTKTLTNKEKLAAALKVCKRDKSKTKKAKCEKQAHSKYGPAKAKKH